MTPRARGGFDVNCEKPKTWQQHRFEFLVKITIIAAAVAFRLLILAWFGF